jgi:pyruvate, water dikinase
MDEKNPVIRWFSDLSRSDTANVGGKNSSLGEMIGKLKEAGINVPDGFATTAAAYWSFLEANDLTERLADKLAELKANGSNLPQVGKAVRKMILQAKFPAPLEEAIARAYREMAERAGCAAAPRRRTCPRRASPASSRLSQRARRGGAARRCKRCYASLFTDRAIVYRENHGFDHMKVALSVGVQRMVRSDKAGAGVMFSIDTETGFPRTC